MIVFLMLASHEHELKIVRGSVPNALFLGCSDRAEEGGGRLACYLRVRVSAVDLEHELYSRLPLVLADKEVKSKTRAT